MEAVKNENNEEFVVHNLSEDMIEERLLPAMNKSDMCTCPRCRADVRSYALNHYPAQYVVSTRGNAWVLARGVSAQTNADLLSAIMQGIALVKKDPRH
ncbi:MAG: late competence development ComFB family protein [Oscillospiraceae bacterium]|jgi:competence protein ComFB|nr:late competence development ComFB family protein [Oscillospiraceae bacterium]